MQELKAAFERTPAGSNQETEDRDCPKLCFFDVPHDMNLELSACPINQGRDRRESAHPQKPTQRLVGGNTALTGAFPYVVRLAFQNFDQFHSDSQENFQSMVIHKAKGL